ncbi:hypothetical protein DLREEDagrD3_22380 [Denitratisoma sp. agr-D3]
MLTHDTITTLFSALISLGPGHTVGPVFHNVEVGARLLKIDSRLKGLVINVYSALIRSMPGGGE